MSEPAAPSPPGFGSTLWDWISLARQGNQEAMERIFTNYRAPIFKFVRRCGFAPPDSEDITHDVFLEILEHGVIGRASPDLGRFRSLLIAITKNQIRTRLRRNRAQKRGGEKPARGVAFDTDIEPEARIPDEERVFDQMWTMHLLHRAFKRLERVSRQRGTMHDEIVRLSVFEGASYSEIASQLNLPPGSARNLLHRGRQRLIEFLREEVALYTRRDKEYREEVDHVLRVLKQG
jgi:RNA polymerase sigma-70 factor (ECF subfamily)